MPSQFCCEYVQILEMFSLYTEDNVFIGDIQHKVGFISRSA